MQSFFESAWFTTVYSLLLLLSIAGGYILARCQYLKKQKAWKPSGTENAIIGFYSLLLSFALLTSGNAHKRTDQPGPPTRRCVERYLSGKRIILRLGHRSNTRKTGCHSDHKIRIGQSKSKRRGHCLRHKNGFTLRQIAF